MKKKQMKKLIEVLIGEKITSFDSISTNKVWYTRVGDTLSSYMGVHKMQNRCKKWAAKNGAPIYSTRTQLGGIAKVDDEVTVHIGPELASTEYEATFAVCIGVMEHLEKASFK